jgi:hypothetical protein
MEIDTVSNRCFLVYSIPGESPQNQVILNHGTVEILAIKKQQRVISMNGFHT